MRSESVVRFPEGFTLRCRVIGVPPHLVREGTPVRPATGSDQDAVGDLVVEVCGVRDTDERERWRGRQ
ncbi:hypothetical protein [Streptomyces mesophilus]|nr:hypothetical protein [Streptomyces mesophilus]